MLAKIIKASKTLLLLWLLLTMAVSAYSAENGTITGDRVRVRSEPSLSGKILTHLNKEARVEVITRTATAQMINDNYHVWYYINHDGLLGYVFGHFVKLDKFTLIPVEGYAESDVPPVPFIDVGACPFEGCTYWEWTVEKETIIRETMDENSPIAFVVKAGEKVNGITGVVITTRPGRAEILKPIEYYGTNLRPGDIVYFLTYVGEALYLTWFKGKLFEFDPYDEDDIRVDNEPKSVWWVKIKNSKGQTGWSNRPNNFDGMDKFG
jgi:hypothetical protein